MVIISSSRIFFYFLCMLSSLTLAQDQKDEVTEEESRTVNTFASRSDRGQRAQVVTGTFRYELHR